MRVSSLSFVCMALGLAVSGSALAQDVERLPFRGDQSGKAPENRDIRFIKSGALLIASFDADHDFIVTTDEIKAGARLAFKIADANSNESMSPLEQRSWASKIASERDVLGNASLFAGAIPGQVSEDEFVRGLVTFSERFEDQEGMIRFTNLTVQPGGQDVRDKQEPKPRNIADRTN